MSVILSLVYFTIKGYVLNTTMFGMYKLHFDNFLINEHDDDDHD